MEMAPDTCTFRLRIIPIWGISIQESTTWRKSTGMPSFSFPNKSTVRFGNSNFDRQELDEVCSTPTTEYPSSLRHFNQENKSCAEWKWRDKIRALVAWKVTYFDSYLYQLFLIYGQKSSWCAQNRSWLFWQSNHWKSGLRSNESSQRNEPSLFLFSDFHHIQNCNYEE